MGNETAFAIRERYQRVLGQIEQATIRSGRLPDSVRLVTVTKSQPVKKVQAAIEAGARILGENYAEEAVAKIELLGEDKVAWHMIGHVQSRKAKLVARYFSMLHSLDSARLATRLDGFCNELDRTLQVLLEVNVSGEQSKSGLAAWDESAWSDLEPAIDQILDLPHLRVLGLMTMPPIMKDPELSRPFFTKMRRLQAYLAGCFPRAGWTELSMGTSADFVVAIEEGATLVRVGRSILGERPLEETNEL